MKSIESTNTEMSTQTTPNEDREPNNPITTATGRQRLVDVLRASLREARNTLIEAPTSLGKSYTVASTRWRDHPELTGESPVVVLHATRDARDEAVEVSQEAGVKSVKLEGREDTCPVAAGEFDDELPTVDGRRPSEWLNWQCNTGGVPFRTAHYALQRELGGLPCGETQCRSQAQWQAVDYDEEEDLPPFDIIHATHSFGLVPELVEGANVIFDERPTFFDERQPSPEAVKDSVNNLLARNASGEGRWTELVEAALNGDEAVLRRYRRVFSENSVWEGPSKHEDRHWQAADIGLAITNVTQYGDSRYCGWANSLGVVFDVQGNLRGIHRPPDLSEARCVIGLDAHPCEQLWLVNTVGDMVPQPLLSGEERRHWRRDERGLRVVQVGAYTRPLTGGWRSELVEQKAEAIVCKIRNRYVDEFSTAISPKSLTDDTQALLKSAGVDRPESLYYGNLRSCNDFESECVGLLIGCIDAGDDYVLDRLALCGLSAEPEEYDNGNRAHGRGFIGEDSEAASDLLASVRESGVAQAAGRYARSPDSDESEAVVYVWTDAIPPHMVDEQVPGVVSKITDTKQEIVRYVSDESVATSTEVAEHADCTKQHALDVLSTMVSQGIAEQCDEKGPYGAYRYRYLSGGLELEVELGF
jgi:hypothetical protein